MQKTFKFVRGGNLEEVRRILDANPSEIDVISKQPPKKDDGQSLLQVAIKSGNMDIANLLLDYGANVNFIESEECCNEWRMPVMHDAIRAAIMCSRWNNKSLDGKSYVVNNTKEKSDKAFNLLKRILELGADINTKDSFDNTCLDRAVLDTIQILPYYNYQTHEVSDNRKITSELREDLNRIFNILFKYGAKKEWLNDKKGLMFTVGPIVEFINQDVNKNEKKSFFSSLFKK